MIDFYSKLIIFFKFTFAIIFYLRQELYFMKTKDLTFSALFVVLMAVLSQFVISLGPVPFNLGVLGAFLTGLMLTPKNALLSILVYIALGLIGLPVFAGFSGGAGVLFGMTGGYIIGHIFIAVITVFASRLTSELAGPTRLMLLTAAMVLSLFICYAFGTAWFMFLTKNTLWQSLAVCVIPFIIPDLLKLCAALFAAEAIRKRIPGTLNA